jgi:hypothetical protein
VLVPLRQRRELQRARSSAFHHDRTWCGVGAAFLALRRLRRSRRLPNLALISLVGAEPHSTHGSVENVERKKMNSADTRCSAECRGRQTACILAKLAQTSYNTPITEVTHNTRTLRTVHDPSFMRTNAFTRHSQSSRHELLLSTRLTLLLTTPRVASCCSMPLLPHTKDLASKQGRNLLGAERGHTMFQPDSTRSSMMDFNTRLNTHVTATQMTQNATCWAERAPMRAPATST